MSDPKLRRIRGDATPLSPLRSRPETGEFVAWDVAPPKADESCRWQCADGRWISVSIGTGDQLGSVIVAASDGRTEIVSSFEDALALAKSWRA